MVVGGGSGKVVHYRGRAVAVVAIGRGWLHRLMGRVPQRRASKTNNGGSGRGLNVRSCRQPRRREEEKEDVYIAD